MERAFQEIHLFTWNYADHDLACLSAFPDSKTFYEGGFIKPDEFSSIFYLATCNRIELYIETAHRRHAIEHDELKVIFKDTMLLPGLESHTPVYKRGLDSVRHLFQVAAGLKSMALGETQITGQLKRDYAYAREKGYISSFMHALVQKVFETQKKIRTQTRIGQNPISLLSLLEKEIASQDENFIDGIHRAVLGGTGDMCQKSLRYLINKGVNSFIVIRHNTQASLPAEFAKIVDAHMQKNSSASYSYMTWDELWQSSEQLSCEILVASTNTEEPLLNQEKISRLKNSGFLSSNAFVIDFGIPPNVDTRGIESEKALEEHRVINLDRLLRQSKINKNLRGMHYREALPIIEKSIHVFWMDYLYSRNPELVNSVLSKVEKESQDEWSNLLSGPLKTISEKQKRILVDYMKKQERRALRTHKELFVDMLTVGEEDTALAN